MNHLRLLTAAVLLTGCLEDVSVGLSASAVLVDASLPPPPDASDDGRLDASARDAGEPLLDAAEADAGLYQQCAPSQCAIFGITTSGSAEFVCDDGGLAQCLETAAEPCNWYCL